MGSKGVAPAGSLFLFFFFVIVFLGDVVVVKVDVAHALLVTLLLVAAVFVAASGRSLSHELRHVRLVRVRADDLWAGLLLELALVNLHDSLDDLEGLLELRLTLASVVGHHLALVVRRCDHFELQLPRLVVHFVLCGQQCLSDSLDAVVASASQGEVNADFKRVHCQFTVQSRQQLLLVVFADVDLRKHQIGVLHSDAHGVKSVLEATVLVKFPTPGLIELLDGRLQLHCHFKHDLVHLLRLLPALISLIKRVWHETLLAQIDIHFLLVDPEDLHHFSAANLEMLLDGANAPC
mmetsp:Transcript_31399/g.41590  ORF Transcript_31399/g.41590 Transcript_31399/m.41590 type:complete len:293 (+) Transcript_31399:57-935(+)